MNEKAQRLEHLFKKVDLMVDDLMNTFDSETLLMMQQACVTLEAKTRADEMVITSVYVKALILDDLRMIQKNLDTIKTAVKFKSELKFEAFCLN
jgi:hypothetical protein